MREKYLSLNGDDQYTFLISHMQIIRDQGTRATSTHVEYFLDLSIKCCRVAFKIAHSIGNMRLQRIQERMVKGSWIPFNTNAWGGKGIIGCHCINWLHVYFSKHYNIMPTIHHHICMVDLLARTGHLKEAENVFLALNVNHNGCRILLTAGRTFGNLDLGKRCFERVQQKDNLDTSECFLMLDV